MEFWWGVVIGVFAGANIGIVMAGLLAGAKRNESSREFPWEQLQMDQAVMEGVPVKTKREVHPLAGASADPAVFF